MANGRSKGGLRPGLWLYLEDERQMPVLDQTDARILRFIQEKRSIADAAKEVGISYRNAWGRVEGMERRLGFEVVEKKVGGRRGGSTELTERATLLLADFRTLRRRLFDTMDDEEWGRPKGSRRAVKARVLRVVPGPKSARVTLSLPKETRVASSLSAEALRVMQLKPGDDIRVAIYPSGVVPLSKLASEDDAN